MENDVHSELSLLRGVSLKATGRAAEAMPSFITALSLIMYAESHKALEGMIEVRVSFLEMMQVPQMCSEAGCKGLISVTSLPGFHLICLSITSVLFVHQARYSGQGNI
ncbi:hypothetical protein F4803DRAFT_300103 [Xylaria telfairii]|nr:hypothetical protein F4803DRAFT_300103 [Xylaria telfairii]